MFYLILVSISDTGTVILELFLPPCVSLHSGKPLTVAKHWQKHCITN